MIPPSGSVECPNTHPEISCSPTPSSTIIAQANTHAARLERALVCESMFCRGQQPPSGTPSEDKSLPRGLPPRTRISPGNCPRGRCHLGGVAVVPPLKPPPTAVTHLFFNEKRYCCSLYADRNTTASRSTAKTACTLCTQGGQKRRLSLRYVPHVLNRSLFLPTASLQPYAPTTYLQKKSVSPCATFHTFSTNPSF